MIKATVVCLAVTWAGAVVSQRVKVWWNSGPEYANLPIKEYDCLCNHLLPDSMLKRKCGVRLPGYTTHPLIYSKHCRYGLCEKHLPLYEVGGTQCTLPTYVEGGWK